MATTTQILFNSPALHSLKRDQLVKLCKIHSIKATGKNIELIERLKQRAQDMPRDTLSPELLQVAGSEDTSDSGQSSHFQMPRPSEQWEIVMEDIEEAQEDSMGTMNLKGSLRSKNAGGEFGTANSKTSTIGSLKAFASSFGIKRAGSAKSVANSQHTVPGPSSHSDELARHAVPYAQLPAANVLPQTDHFRFSTPDGTMRQDADGDVSMSAPLPGSPSRPGVAAPHDARLSMGTGMTTTIRLINSASQEDMPSPPHLAPFQTTFDIQMGSPGPNNMPGRGVSVWPASPAKEQERLYPAIPFNDFPRPGSSTQQAEDSDVDMPGGMSPAPQANSARPQATPARATRASATPKFDHTDDVFSPMKPAAVSGNTDSAGLAPLPRSAPFLFGSPLPQHNTSNKEFGSAAASVLEEMNRRLAQAGTKKVDGGLLAGGSQVGASVLGGGVVGANNGIQRAESGDRFAKAHDEAFNKMDSIATHYAARRGAARKRKSDVLGAGQAPGAKRKSSAANARVISNGVRKNMIPGGFGDDDGEEEAEDPGDRRSSKRMRVADSGDVREGKRVSIAPPPVVDAEEAQAKRDKEREAIRRKLDANKARRRSSRGRASIGGKAVPAAKGKTSRFGFLSSAKSIVKNVWSLGAGSSNATKSVAPPTSNSKSSIPVPKAMVESKGPPPKPSTSATNASIKSTASRVASGSSSSSASLLKPPNSSIASKNGGTINSARSSASAASRVRSPIPSFNGITAATSRPSSIAGTAASRAGSSTGTGTAASRITMRPSSMAGASSMGLRTSVAHGLNAAVSSIGTRRSVTGTAAAASSSSRKAGSSAVDAENVSVIPRTRTSSLLAPTASSLAKMQGSARSPAHGNPGRASGLPVVAERGKAASRVSSASKAALEIITNSPQSPKRGKIFSQPLTPAAFSSPTARTSLKPNPSLSAAANALLSTPSAIPKPVPPRPKTLVARKPRISRSRVIAKLGAQRAAGQSSTVPIAPSARLRSSMGARKSAGGLKAGRTSAGADVMRSAVKKRARQSEYTRRRSHAPATGVADTSAMEVDD